MAGSGEHVEFSQMETDTLSCGDLVLLGPPEAFPREPQASPHIHTLLSKKRP